MCISYMKKVLILLFLVFFTHPVFAYINDDYYLNRKYDELERKVNTLENQYELDRLKNSYEPKYYYNSKDVKLDFNKETQGIPRYSNVKYEDKYNGLMKYDYEMDNQKHAVELTQEQIKRMDEITGLAKYEQPEADPNLRNQIIKENSELTQKLLIKQHKVIYSSMLKLFNDIKELCVNFLINYCTFMLIILCFISFIIFAYYKRNFICKILKQLPKDNYYLLAYITLIYLLLLTLYCLLSYEITNSTMGLFQISAWGVSVFSFWSAYREFNNNKNSKWLLPLVFLGILYNQIFKIRFEDWNIINLVSFAILTSYLVLNIRKINN